MTVRSEALAKALREYRNSARMPQWVLAELLGLEQQVIADVEAGRPVEDANEEQVRGYLATAPRPRRLRQVLNDPDHKPTLKAAYDVAKRDFGLASIPMVQLEVENALTLATRGRYRAMTRPTRELRYHG